jgi:hypothetical protein
LILIRIRAAELTLNGSINITIVHTEDLLKCHASGGRLWKIGGIRHRRKDNIQIDITGMIYVY